MNVRLVQMCIAAAGIFLALQGCDIYEGENDIWPNEVTITMRDLTQCPLYFSIDGEDKGFFQPGESYTQENLGQGVHFLEAFAWNELKVACDSVYTGDLKNGEVFEWDVLPDGNCGVCDPTPTPTAFPTPEPTATPGH